MWPTAFTFLQYIFCLKSTHCFNFKLFRRLVEFKGFGANHLRKIQLLSGSWFTPLLLNCSHGHGDMVMKKDKKGCSWSGAHTHIAHNIHYSMPPVLYQWQHMNVSLSNDTASSNHKLLFFFVGQHPAILFGANFQGRLTMTINIFLCVFLLN